MTKKVNTNQYEFNPVTKKISSRFVNLGKKELGDKFLLVGVCITLIHPLIFVIPSYLKIQRLQDLGLKTPRNNIGL